MNSFSCNRCDHWQLRTRTFHFGPLPAVMGILNVTPDSFSDGGRFFSPSLAVDQALRLIDEGADFLDIGGESTRPYSQPVDTDEELKRVVPVLEALAGRCNVPLSIDTSKARVAKEAMQIGAEIINDVTGFCDPAMVEAAAQSDAAICVMHMRGTPQTMQENPSYSDVIGEIVDFLAQRAGELEKAGIARSRICLDPGIGFGKTHEHNMTLMKSANAFVQLGWPILIGHSRKGFIAKLIGDKHADRTAGTIGASLALAHCGVQLIRVHDVAATRHALACYEACGGLA